MAILKVHRPELIFVTNRDILTDNRLSWGAKGLLISMLGSDEKQRCMKEINKFSKDGKLETTSYICELAKCGYAVIDINNPDDGVPSVLEVFEHPCNKRMLETELWNIVLILSTQKNSAFSKLF